MSGVTLRAVMVDVDGVVIVPRPGGWAVDIERDLGISLAVLETKFFRRHWQDLTLGRAALHQRLAPVLAKHAPHLTSQALVDYWFAKDALMDEALLSDLAVLRDGGVQVHLATVQEHERARYLWDTLGFRDRFDALHYAADLGAAKPDPAFYKAIEMRTGLSGQELLLLDDRLGNVEAARASDWRGALWTGQRSLAETLADAW